MSQPGQHFYEFGSFRLDTVERLFLRNGETIALPPKAVDLLLVLVMGTDICWKKMNC